MHICLIDLAGLAFGLDHFIPNKNILYSYVLNIEKTSDMAGTGTLIWLVDNIKLSATHINVKLKFVRKVSSREALKNTCTTMWLDITCSQSTNSERSLTKIFQHARRVIMPNNNVNILAHAACRSKIYGLFVPYPLCRAHKGGGGGRTELVMYICLSIVVVIRLFPTYVE